MSRPISSESTFRAVADPTRRRVLDLLRRRECPPSEIAESLRLRPSTLTFHLRVLAAAGLVEQHRAGRRRVYRLNLEWPNQIQRWLGPYERPVAKPRPAARVQAEA
jgi:DNA-binding transcriptional ArsR family regulator